MLLGVCSLGNERAHINSAAKVNVLRDSHKPFLTPNREFERQFGGKTVLAGLRLKKQ
jgi:hypothetical protein